jgi:DNA-binding beta-propeller fold protein YncE
VRMRKLSAAIMTTALAAMVGLGPAVSVAFANGIGDLYVAQAKGVDEVHVASHAVVNTVPLTPAPTALAFTPDGTKLYTANGGRFVTRIDIETISVADRLPVPANAIALAHPKGDLLAIAFESLKVVDFLDPTDDTLRATETLPGAVDLIAADRRDPRLVAAEFGASWIAVIDPSTRAIRTGTVKGDIVAIAVDSDSGSVFVATSGPDTVIRIGLSDLKPKWTTDLADAPVALTAVPAGAIVSLGKVLWMVTATDAIKWGTAPVDVATLATSDDSSIVYAAVGDAIAAFGSDGKIARSIPLGAKAAPSALAPIPRASSIAGASGGLSGIGSGGSSGASAKPNIHAPATDTVVEAAGRLLSSSAILSAAAIAVVILAATFVAARWHVRRQTV